MFILKYKIVLMTSLFIGCWISNVMAISREVLLHEQMEKCDLVVMGTITDQQNLFKISKDANGKLIPSLEIIATIHTVEIKKILFGKERFTKVFIFQRLPYTEESAFYEKDKFYLLFLKEIKIDPKIITDYKLKEEIYYEATFGSWGVYTEEEIEEKPGFVPAVETFGKIKNIKNESNRKKAWKKLLKSKNPILKESAKVELQKIKTKDEESTNE